MYVLTTLLFFKSKLTQIVNHCISTVRFHVRLNYLTIFYGLMINSRQPIKLSVLSVVLPSPPSKLGLLSVPLLLPHWFSTKCSHGSLFHSHRGSPHLQQIHTQASAENCTHPQQSVHILQPHRSNILYPSHFTRNSWRDLYITSWSPPSFAQAISVAVRQNNFGISAVSNWGFSSGSSTT